MAGYRPSKICLYVITDTPIYVVPDRMPVKQSRSGMRGRWQPSGWVSGGRGGRCASTANQTAATTRESSASKVLLLVWSHWYLKYCYFKYCYFKQEGVG